MASLTDRLNEELAAVRGELTRLDGKCSTLAGLAGAAVAFVLTRTAHGPLTSRLLLATAGIALATAAVVLLGTVLRPRFGPTFCRFAAMTSTEICSLLGGRAGADDIDRARDLEVLSGIARTKNRRLRLAVDLIVTALALITAGMLTAL
jgi:Family of unknown function (DUF5706)